MKGSERQRRKGKEIKVKEGVKRKGKTRKEVKRVKTKKVKDKGGVETKRQKETYMRCLKKT